jgi:antitoxin (DNA-binding transcriptional repressor) of toxin-antitoxin stability system
MSQWPGKEGVVETVDIEAAKTALERIVDAAAGGAEIVIARAGNPVAKLVPLSAPGPETPRVLGLMAGRIRTSADFDAPLPDELLDLFEGR